MNRGVLGPLFPVVHNQLLCFADVEGEVQREREEQIEKASPPQIFGRCPMTNLTDMTHHTDNEQLDEAHIFVPLLYYLVLTPSTLCTINVLTN